MKYKKILVDEKINEEIKMLNMAEVARRMGVSKTYLYMALKEKFVVTEKFYKKFKEIITNKNGV